MGPKVECPVCKRPVAIFDGVVEPHGSCPISGLHLMEDPVRLKSGPGGPEISIIGLTQRMECPGDEHHSPHGFGLAVGRVKIPNPAFN